MSLAKVNGQIKKTAEAPVSARRRKRSGKYSNLPPLEQVLRNLRALARDWLIEIRLLDCKPQYGRPFSMSGYFTDYDAAAEAIVAADEEHEPGGAYVTLNPVQPELLARSANELTKYPKYATRNNEISHRRRIVLDMDPVRPPGISSTAAQVAAAKTLSRKIRTALREEYGWPYPILTMMSANGVQSIYSVDLPNDDDATGLVKKVLEAVGQLFDTEAVKVDQSVHDAAQIVKVAGTTGRKGSSTEDRPHRRARLLFMSTKPAKVSRKRLEAMAALVTVPDKPVRSEAVAKRVERHEITGPNKSSRLDVAKYLTDYRVVFTALAGVDSEGRKRWTLAVCPFDSNHTGRDAAILQHPNGKLAFKCFHNSCRLKGWKDVRKLIGPPLPRHCDPPGDDRILANSRAVTDEGSEAKAVHVVRPAREIVEELFSLTGGWPKRVGKLLFVRGPGGQPHYFEGKRDVDALYAWVQSLGIRTSWRKGAGLLSRSELFEHLCIASEEFASIETLPHEPSLPKVYYMVPNYPNGQGAHLEKLVDRFHPATEGDRALIMALFLTPFWGGLAGR